MATTLASKPPLRVPDFPLTPQSLERWIRFSAKGGIGRATAKVDRVSEDGESFLMMLEGDEIVVLMDLGQDIYLGHCEGVVGLFRSEDVQFLQRKLKNPVMVPRSRKTKPVAPETSTGLTLPDSLDSPAYPSTGRVPESEEHDGRPHESGSSGENSIGPVSDDSTRWKQQVSHHSNSEVGSSRVKGTNRGDLNGLYIEVRSEGSGDGQRARGGALLIGHDETDDLDGYSTVSSPDLAGAFRTLSHSPAVPLLASDRSPAYSSDSHIVPSLLTSPQSDNTSHSHSASEAPYTPSSDVLSTDGMFKRFLPGSPSVLDHDPAMEQVHAEHLTAKKDHDPADDTRRFDSSLPLVANGLFLSPRDVAPSFTYPTRSQASYAASSALTSLLSVRQPKTSDSTVGSQISQGSVPSSLPGTPGDDPTLAFVFDSYRYSDSPSLAGTTSFHTSSTPGSRGDSSSLTRLRTNDIAQLANSDYFPASSPVSSSTHSDSLPPPSRDTPDFDQYPRRRFPSLDKHTPSPSTDSFDSARSIHAAPQTSDDHDTATTDGARPGKGPTTPNKLRKKSSFRLRAFSSTRRPSADHDASAQIAMCPTPPLPSLPNSARSDSLSASSPPSSPAPRIMRKNSIGSKFVRDRSEREKIVNYGAGISSKDFEEETIQIGASAFEIVKPYAALLSHTEDASTVVFEGQPADASQHHPSPSPHSLFPAAPRDETSTPSPRLARSFSTATSHFSPPTPMSLEGGEGSVENHRARELKWVQILSSGISAAEVRKSKKMRSLVQSGVPSSVRGKVWVFLAEAEREKKPKLFEHLCLLGEGRFSVVIEEDVESLLFDNLRFAEGSAGREDLLAVLNAFSHFDRQLGYYRGLTNVAATLLYAGIPAEDSFFTLVSLVKNYAFQHFFEVGREELRLEMMTFSHLLERLEPKIARRFREFDIGTTDYLFSWLSTFFCSILPLSTVLRIVDVFLFDPKTRYRAPLAILRLAQFTDPDLFPSRDSVLNYLLAPPPTAVSPSILIPAVDFKLSDKDIEKATKKAARDMLTPRN